MNSETLDIKSIWDALAAIPDPEFGINLVDLGLIYSVECAEGDVKVVMTLTTPTCPSGGWMYEGVKAAVEKVSGVKTVQVDLVFDPEWTPEMLSPSARSQLGWDRAADGAPAERG
jgi:metal-sulfur cluster biosynthetic enzyme